MRDQTADLAYRSEFEHLVLKMSSRLMVVDADEIDSFINESLRQIAEFVEADCAHIHRFAEDQSTFSMTHLFASDQIDLSIDRMQNLPSDDLPDWMAKLRAGTAIPTASIRSLPESTAELRNRIMRQGICSQLDVPILYRDELVGLLGLSSSVDGRIWNEDEVKLLKIGGQLFYSALERRRWESEIEKSRMHTDAILENLVDGVITMSEEGLIERFSPSSERIFGYEAEEMIGKPITLMMPEMFRDLHTKGLNRYLETEKAGVMGTTVELVAIRKDGSHFPVTLAISVFELEGRKTYTGVIRDISESRKLQESLRISEERFSLALTAASVGVWDFDREDGLSTNPEYFQMLGYEPEEFAGNRWPLAGLLHPDDREEASRWLHEHLASSTPGDDRMFESEFRLKKKSGGYRWVQSRGKVIEWDESGKPTRSIGIQVDITERIEAEIELERAKNAAEAANRAKSTFLANMSHELRTPLTAILGYSQILMTDDLPSDETHEFSGIIHKSGKHLIDLINDVLDLAKIEAGHLTLELIVFDLSASLESLEGMMRQRAEEKGLDLTFTLGESIPQFLLMDERKLRQVIVNLVSNAIKFTSEGYVAVRFDYDPEQELMSVEVEDSGAGIAQEDFPKLFEPFVQTQTGLASRTGTGLGLPISREFVRLMGGELTVESEMGTGSTFRFLVNADPVALLKGTDSGKRVVGLAPGQQAWRVLVVDDNEINCRMLANSLRSVDFEVRKAGDGQTAVDEFRSWRPHLIWMDNRMPVMSGVEAAQAIRASEGGKDTVIIALSTSVLDEEFERVLETGSDDFMQKPYYLGEVFEMIAKHLDIEYVYSS